jgi:hypothetical protein
MSGFEQGQDTVEKVATFMVCGRFLLESAKDRFLGVDPYDSMCHHVSGIESATGKGMAIPRLRLVQEEPEMEKP